MATGVNTTTILAKNAALRQDATHAYWQWGHGVSRQVGHVGQDGLITNKFDGFPQNPQQCSWLQGPHLSTNWQQTQQTFVLLSIATDCHLMNSTFTVFREGEANTAPCPCLQMPTSAELPVKCLITANYNTYRHAVKKLLSSTGVRRICCSAAVASYWLAAASHSLVALSSAQVFWSHSESVAVTAVAGHEGVTSSSVQDLWYQFGQAVLETLLVVHRRSRQLCSDSWLYCSQTPEPLATL